MPLVVVRNDLEKEHGLARVNPESDFLAMVRQTLGALTDAQFVQEGRNLLFDHSALAHPVHKGLRVAVPNS